MHSQCRHRKYASLRFLLALGYLCLCLFPKITLSDEQCVVGVEIEGEGSGAQSTLVGVRCSALLGGLSEKLGFLPISVDDLVDEYCPGASIDTKKATEQVKCASAELQGEGGSQGKIQGGVYGCTVPACKGEGTLDYSNQVFVESLFEFLLPSDMDVKLSSDPKLCQGKYCNAPTGFGDEDEGSGSEEDEDSGVGNLMDKQTADTVSRVVSGTVAAVVLGSGVAMATVGGGVAGAGSGASSATLGSAFPGWMLLLEQGQFINMLGQFGAEGTSQGFDAFTEAFAWTNLQFSFISELLPDSSSSSSSSSATSSPPSTSSTGSSPPNDSTESNGLDTTASELQATGCTSGTCEYFESIGFDNGNAFWAVLIAISFILSLLLASALIARMMEKDKRIEYATSLGPYSSRIFGFITTFFLLTPYTVSMSGTFHVYYWVKWRDGGGGVLWNVGCAVFVMTLFTVGFAIFGYVLLKRRSEYVRHDLVDKRLLDSNGNLAKKKPEKQELGTNLPGVGLFHESFGKSTGKKAETQACGRMSGRGSKGRVTHPYCCDTGHWFDPERCRDAFDGHYDHRDSQIVEDAQKNAVGVTVYDAHRRNGHDDREEHRIKMKEKELERKRDAFKKVFGAFYIDFTYENRYFFLARFGTWTASGVVMGLDFIGPVPSLLILLALHFILLVLLLWREPYFYLFLMKTTLAMVVLKALLLFLTLTMVFLSFFGNSFTAVLSYVILAVNLLVMTILVAAQVFSFFKECLQRKFKLKTKQIEQDMATGSEIKRRRSRDSCGCDLAQFQEKYADDDGSTGDEDSQADPFVSMWSPCEDSGRRELFMTLNPYIPRNNPTYMGRADNGYEVAETSHNGQGRSVHIWNDWNCFESPQDSGVYSGTSSRGTDSTTGPGLTMDALRSVEEMYSLTSMRPYEPQIDAAAAYEDGVSSVRSSEESTVPQFGIVRKL